MTPENLFPLAVFKQRMDPTVSAFEASPEADGSDCIYVPGEIEYLKEQAYRAESIPMAAAVMQELGKVASRVGVEFPWSRGES